MLINIEKNNQVVNATGFASKNNVGAAVIHGYGDPPSEYNLKYIPHMVVIDTDGTVLMNYKGDWQKALEGKK